MTPGGTVAESWYDHSRAGRPAASSFRCDPFCRVILYPSGSLVRTARNCPAFIEGNVATSADDSTARSRNRADQPVDHARAAVPEGEYGRSIGSSAPAARPAPPGPRSRRPPAAAASSTTVMSSRGSAACLAGRPCNRRCHGIRRSRTRFRRPWSRSGSPSRWPGSCGWTTSARFARKGSASWPAGPERKPWRRSASPCAPRLTCDWRLGLFHRLRASPGALEGAEIGGD